MVFLGGEPLGLPSLSALCAAGLTPDLVVCNPDRPAGRGQSLQAPAIKVWAEENGIDIFQPDSYKDPTTLSTITEQTWDLFVVVAYNFILPKWFLELPKHGVINVHPSLLPKLRGASPIRTAIINNAPEHIGVSIMLMDEAMDHGPLLAQEPLTIDTAQWPMVGPELDALLAHTGGELLARTIPAWLEGTITPTEQDHVNATYTKKFNKADSELFLDPNNLPGGDEALQTFLKIKAYAGMFDTFFMDHGKRIKIKAATLSQAGELLLLRVTPEGKKEIDFTLYLQSR
jgi:methionyl-tRNA formyltransferase